MTALTGEAPAGLRFYKTAFVVRDFARATREFDALGPYDWREVPAAPGYTFRIGDDVHDFPIRALISFDWPRIHLFEPIPGTPWALSDAPGAHHAAYFASEFDAVISRMLIAGHRIEACDNEGGGTPTQWAYMLSPSGARTEILNSFGMEAPDLTMLESFPPYRTE